MSSSVDMNTLEDMRLGVQNDLVLGDESGLFDPNSIDLALNRSYRKIGGLFRWPETEDALLASAEAGQEFYDYPDNWRPDSIWHLEVDGVMYGTPREGAPLVFKDYMYEKNNNNPSNIKNKYANRNNQFFLDPTPSANGTDNIGIWGQKVVEEMDEDDDLTIFSYIMPEVNEAVVLEAVAILKNKGEEPQVGQLLSAQATAIVTNAWNRIKQDTAKEQKTQPGFNIPDFFGNNSGSVKNKIGNF